MPSIAREQPSSSQKRAEPKLPVQSPAFSRIQTDAKELEAASDTAINPPSAIPFPQSGTDQPLFVSPQSNQVWATTMATKIKTKRAKSSPPNCPGRNQSCRVRR